MKEQLFFELIQVAIGTRDGLSRIPSESEWEALYDMAEKQSLIGICFAGLLKLGANVDDGYLKIGMSEELFFRWIGTAAAIQQTNKKMNKRCVELQERLKADGFRSCILKGQGVAQLYGKEMSVMRQSGDIDVFVDCGRTKILEYLESIGQKDLEWDYVHTHANFFNDAEIEIHYRAGAVRNIIKNRRLQKFWKRNEDEFFQGKLMLPNGEIVCPSERMNIFYLIHHTYRHLISGGIGLRQVMDVYFALQSRHKENDMWIKEQVATFGMEEFAEATIWVMKEVFGMQTDALPWKPNESEGRFLLDEIMIGGNFGKEDKRFTGGSSKRGVLYKIAKRNLHLARHYGCDALAAPFYYIWHFLWKRLHGFMK